ncbi:transposase [Streptomyces sp. NBS 14/10]|uniref:transposase n=1 Tax=Streptomyces sp. NBS 14/10 TaxID=1945643 RepID=UPI00211B303C|nr:transposase [Streptomyces sp. NBS 14/10]KAK1185871.1 transposase [Streptomyces sp. NBS 14/10]
MPELPLLACTFRGHVTTIPKVRLSKLVNSFKGVSSRYLREKYDAHVRRHLWGGHFWSGSYIARSCVGAPLTVVRQYNENQQRPV